MKVALGLWNKISSSGVNSYRSEPMDSAGSEW